MVSRPIPAGSCQAFYGSEPYGVPSGAAPAIPPVGFRNSMWPSFFVALDGTPAINRSDETLMFGTKASILPFFKAGSGQRKAGVCRVSTSLGELPQSSLNAAALAPPNGSSDLLAA